MKSGLRLLLITFLTGLALAFAWLTLKAFENKKPVQPGTWHHPLADITWWQIARPAHCADGAVLKKEIESSNKETVWFLDVQVQKDSWVVFCSSASSSELFQRWQTGVDLKDLLPAFSTNERFVLFNIHASQEAEAQSFLREVAALEKLDRVAVVSPSRVPLEKIRKERPQWLFGADRTTWTKVLAMNSIRLAGIVSLWPDFFIVSVEEQKALGPGNPLYSYLKEQNKILIQEVDSEMEKTSSNLPGFRGRLFTKE